MRDVPCTRRVVLPHVAAKCRFPPKERAALLMVGRLTAALPYALRAHMLQAEEVDCYAQPVDLPGDLKVRPCSGMSSYVSASVVGANMLSLPVMLRATDRPEWASAIAVRQAVVVAHGDCYEMSGHIDVVGRSIDAHGLGMRSSWTKHICEVAALHYALQKDSWPARACWVRRRRHGCCDGSIGPWPLRSCCRPA